MTQEEKLYEELGTGFSDAVAGKLFGKPCYKIEGKAFLCFFRSSAVFKLPPTERDGALAKSGATLFDPSGKGRPMKEWVQLPFLHNTEWKRFAAAAYAYVKSNAS